MRKRRIALLLTILAYSIARADSATSQDIAKLKLPDGFHVNVFAKLPSAPRMLALDSQGHMYVTLVQANQVVMLPDTNHDGAAETPEVVADNLNSPNGLAFVGNDLLVANQDGIVKLSQKDGVWGKPQPFISHLPTGGHTLKSIKLGVDNFLYVNIGSSCNVCLEDDASRATILRFTRDGKPAAALEVIGHHSQLAPIWASGLRNSQGFAWHPKTGAMFATNEGADNRSETKGGKVNDELPPEHLNIIQPGKNYGWPHCWAIPNRTEMFTDPNFAGSDNFCKNSTPPAITFTSHSTPIGITFLDKSSFPSEYKNDAIVALHGSWNRTQPSGYRLVRVIFNGNEPSEVVDFATGWLRNNEAWGRPVDAIVGTDGALYVSDDKANLIYRIIYNKK